MAHGEIKRTQANLLVESLFSFKDDVSPLNLLLDSPEQSARPLVLEYIRRAKQQKLSIIYVSFETIGPPKSVDYFIRCRRKSNESIRLEVRRLLDNKRCLIIVDSTSQLSLSPQSFVEMLKDLARPQVSLVLVQHVPYGFGALLGYGPCPSLLLRHLATTLIALEPLSQASLRLQAHESSRAEPSFGLESEQDGVIAGIGANCRTGIRLQIEHRRKSGRTVGLNIIMSDISIPNLEPRLVLADELLGSGRNQENSTVNSNGNFKSTFELSLNDRQREARDAVLPPYFDAQNGGLTGGKILYDIGQEDDFDEEEDDI